MEVGTRVRALEKIKFETGWMCDGFGRGALNFIVPSEDCKGTLEVNGRETTLYVKQMVQDESASSPRGSGYKMLAGDEGEIVQVVRPGGSHAPMIIVEFDKYPYTPPWFGSGGENSTRGTPAPVFRVFPHQIM